MQKNPVSSQSCLSRSCVVLKMHNLRPLIDISSTCISLRNYNFHYDDYLHWYLLYSAFLEAAINVESPKAETADCDALGTNSTHEPRVANISLYETTEAIPSKTAGPLQELQIGQLVWTALRLFSPIMLILGLPILSRKSQY